MKCQWSYWPIIKFLVPLALTIVVQDSAEQALNRGMTSATNSTQVLASFGIGYNLIKFATGPLMEIKHSGLVQVHSIADSIQVVFCVAGFAGFIGAFAVLINFTKLGYYVVDQLYSVDVVVSSMTKQCIFYLGLYPLIDGTSWIYSGILLQYKYSVIVGGASLADIFMQIGVIAALLQIPKASLESIIVPIIALYVGCIVRFTIVMTGYFVCVHRKMKALPLGDPKDRLTALKVIWFWWPLGLVQAIQRISRPIVNVFVARDLKGTDQATIALAVLTVTYPVGRVPWGWLNELKAIAPAFSKEALMVDGPSNRVTPKRIRIHNIGALSFSVLIMLIIFWIPGIIVTFLISVIGVEDWMADLCIWPLRIFTFFAFPVATRAHLTSWLLVYKETRIVAPSALVRLICLIVALLVLPLCGVHGASHGIGALLASFCGEAITVACGSACYHFRL
uniref:Progressive ankylosis protein homolog n=1 Tax=Saccoglossus kowalevskii TaxID=10224 RepID=A0ABM0MDX1_SACKO